MVFLWEIGKVKSNYIDISKAVEQNTEMDNDKFKMNI